MVNCLLGHEANPNPMDKEGVTPLMLVAKQGCKPLAEALIEAGAHLDEVDCSGWNASSYARYSGHMELHKWLESMIQERNVPQASSKCKLIGLGNEDPDDEDLEFSEPSEDGRSGDDSWNDESSDESQVKEKPKINISRFMSASKASIDSIASANSQKSNLSRASTPGPQKPPRSFQSTPNLKIKRELKHSLSLRERASSVHEELNINKKSPDKMKDFSINLERVVDQTDQTISGSLKIKDGEQSLSEVSFDDEDGEDNILPSDQISVSLNKKDLCESNGNKEQGRPANLSDEEVSFNAKIDDFLPKNSQIKSREIVENNEESKATQSQPTSCKINQERVTKDSGSSDKEHNAKEKDLTKVDCPIVEAPINNSTDKARDELYDMGEEGIQSENTESSLMVSKEGTLGRIDTLQPMEEVWETNACLSLRENLSDSLNSTYGENSLKNVEEIGVLNLSKTYFGDSKEKLFSDADSNKKIDPASPIDPVNNESNDTINVQNTTKVEQVSNDKFETKQTKSLKEKKDYIHSANMVNSETSEDVKVLSTQTSLNNTDNKGVQDPSNSEVFQNNDGHDECDISNKESNDENLNSVKSRPTNNLFNPNNKEADEEDSLAISNVKRKLFDSTETPETNDALSYTPEQLEDSDDSLHSLDSIASQEPSLHLEDYSLENLKHPLDIERVQQIIRNLKVHLNRENTRKNNFQFQLEQSKKLETLLNEELDQNEETFAQYLRDITQLQSHKNQLEYNLFRSQDEANFMLSALKEAKDQLVVLDQENTSLKLEMVGKEHVINVLQSDLETKARIAASWKAKSQSFSHVPSR